jgi:hypothetical protein
LTGLPVEPWMLPLALPVSEDRLHGVCHLQPSDNTDSLAREALGSLAPKALNGANPRRTIAVERVTERTSKLTATQIAAQIALNASVADADVPALLAVLSDLLLGSGMASTVQSIDPARARTSPHLQTGWAARGDLLDLCRLAAAWHCHSLLWAIPGGQSTSRGACCWAATLEAMVVDSASCATLSCAGVCTDAPGGLCAP